MGKFFRKIKFIIISISLIFIVTGIITYANLFNKQSNNLHSDINLPFSTEVDKSNEVNKSTDDTSKEDTSNKDVSDNTTNILFLDNKSDSMVVASVDSTNKDIKLTPVTNTGYFDRSNMEDLLNSIEKSVNMNLDKFLQVDTSELMDVISVLGDVSVNIKSEDMKLINNFIPKFYAELDDKSKGDMKLIDSPGAQNINEYQAMAYIAVISKDSNKQKEVLLSLVENIKDLDFTKYFKIYSKLKPYVETNLTIPDMLKLASNDYEFK